MTPQKNNALDAFLNLLTHITLGWFAISLGQLIFAIIEKTIGTVDKGYYYHAGNGAFSWPISSLIIITPIFLLATKTLHGHYKSGKLAPNGAIYRWLTYFMLLIASLVIAGDLINIVNKLLDGEYTLNSMLKALTVLFIALGIFLYYWRDMKRTDYSKKDATTKWSATGVIVVTLAAIIGGFIVSDSPALARAKKFDRQRAGDLTSIFYDLDSEFGGDELPETLQTSRAKQYVDPETGTAYPYTKVGAQEYTICATFSHDSDYADEGRFSGASDPTSKWLNHKAGEQCYDVTLSDRNEPTVKVVPEAKRVD